MAWNILLEILKESLMSCLSVNYFNYMNFKSAEQSGYKDKAQGAHHHSFSQKREGKADNHNILSVPFNPATSSCSQLEISDRL